MEIQEKNNPNIITRTPEEIVSMMNDIQNNTLLADGNSCSLIYDLEDTELWINWLQGKCEIS